ncbi:MAG: BtpA/SgcQ family protein [Planctomycetaceae bacterium]
MLNPRWSNINVPVIGMLHAPPLPGSAGFRGDFSEIVRFVCRDATSLTQGGVDGLMLENFGDTPFFPERVPAVTVSAITALAMAVRQVSDLPLGINVLRNDGRSALAIAAVCGADFIRVNVLAGARVTDQGIVQGIAHDLLRERTALGCQHIRIMADVDVKHSASLAFRPIDVETNDLVERAHADVIIVSGQATGAPTDANSLQIVASAASPVPVFVGSGVTAENVADLITAGARGLIVGSSLKHDLQIDNQIDIDRVRSLIEAVRGG